MPFAHAAKDISNILRAARQHFQSDWPPEEMNLHVQVLNAPFYRNKSAYVFGQIINGSHRHPFALAIVHNADGRLMVDAALFNPQQIGVLFSFARAYFGGYARAQRLCALSQQHVADALAGRSLHAGGLAQEAGQKTFGGANLCSISKYSHDRFMLAPGVKGLVMSVFTLPSFPYVFKVIKDKFGPNKDFDQEYVRQKYLLVKKHDRVGRMADTLEFQNVALPSALRRRISARNAHARAQPNGRNRRLGGLSSMCMWNTASSL